MNLLSPATPVLNYGRIVNPASPLNRGLVAWWLTLPQGGKGNTFFDICSKNHGTLTNSPTWSSGLGRPGSFGSLSFAAASSQYALVADSSSINPVTNITFAVWVYITTNPNFHTIYDSGNSANRWRAQLYNSDKLAITEAGIVDHIATTAVAQSTWTHIGFVKNGDGASNVTFYYNGLPDGTASAGAFAATSGSKFIGSTSTPSAYWQGNLDSLRLHNVAFSDAEFAALYREERQGYPTTLSRIRLPVLGEAAVAPGGTVVPLLTLLGVGRAAA